MATELKKSKKPKKRESELIESTDDIKKNPTDHIEDSEIQPKKKKSKIDKLSDLTKASSVETKLKKDEIKTPPSQCDSKDKKKKKKKSDSKAVDPPELETSELSKKENDTAIIVESNVEKKKKKKKSETKVDDVSNLESPDLILGKQETIKVADVENNVRKKKKKKSDSKVSDVPDLEISNPNVGKKESVEAVANEKNVEKKKKKEKKKSDSKSADAPNPETSDLVLGKEKNVAVADNELHTEKKKKKKKSDPETTDIPKLETPDFLLGQKESAKVVDSELDTLFKSSAFLPAPVPDLQPTSNYSKPEVKNTEKPSTKPSRTSISSSTQPNLTVESHENADTGASDEVRSAFAKAQRFAQSLRAAPSTTPTNTKSRVSMPTNLSLAEETVEESDGDGDDDDDDSSVSHLVHETLLSQNTPDSNSHPRPRKTRPIILNETAADRNLRTVFVGNVSVECVKSKALARNLIDHLLKPESESEPLAPRSRIESYRFRGIPLATPIVSRENHAENRSEKRSKTWRETQKSQTDPSGRPSLDNSEGGRVGRRGAKTASDETGTATLPEVQYLNPNQKRKVSYVTGDLHPEAKSCVAFVVISPPPDPPKSEGDGSSLTAQELAKLISEKSDATSFMGHVLRCDLAGARRISQDSSEDTQIIDLQEQRRTLYIGGLDFMEHEDNVRKAVEAQLLAEREGPPSDGGTWVERVRLVRDKGTSLGKGFGYVLLKSQDAVEEMLALESFKIGNRKVRVQKYVVPGRCSALRKLGQQIQTQSTSNQKEAKPSKRIKLDLTRDVPAIYKGPDLSETLASKTKDERKSIKMSTPARVERRILKKQAKLKLEIAGREVNRKIEAMKSKPLKRSISKPTARAPQQQRRPDKKRKA
ncbi:hypothetical protein DFH28DRAFT_881019 [Melampsora americana]|nr:hypothetical protein DFH28DRAFT_881019 [Melampsora americana]